MSTSVRLSPCPCGSSRKRRYSILRIADGAREKDFDDWSERTPLQTSALMIDSLLTDSRPSIGGEMNMAMLRIKKPDVAERSLAQIGRAHF